LWVNIFKLLKLQKENQTYGSRTPSFKIKLKLIVGDFTELSLDLSLAHRDVDLVIE
jgi:hypothetical protein